MLSRPSLSSVQAHLYFCVFFDSHGPKVNFGLFSDTPADVDSGRVFPTDTLPGTSLKYIPLHIAWLMPTLVGVAT